MLKRIYIILLISILFLFPLSIIKVNNKDNPFNNIIITNKEKPIAKLIIKKIKLKEYLYNINSNENNIEKHVTILDNSIFPNKENSIVFIAAHSGTGKIAYFNDLDKLEVNDSINFIYNNKTYNYIVKDIFEEKKDGYININKEFEDQLVLTTCSKNKNKQLIVNCIKKESIQN